MTNASYMARLGQSLICNGYKILPIAPGTKKPGRFASGTWADLSNWDRFAARQPTDLELEAWSSWPGCAVGILGGDVAGVDIDIASDVKLAIAIEELARKRLGDTPALRIGKAPKRMLIYKTAASFKGIKRHPLEILCHGQQFVAYADHPETGQPYAWPQEGLADLDIDSLPVITQDQARSFLDEAYAMLPGELCQQALSAHGPAAPGEKAAAQRPSVQQGTFEAINTALAWLPNAELDYDSWTRVGMAIKGALGEKGRDLFLAWSQQAAKDVPASTLKAWETYKPTSIGAGTLYHLAMERGWQPAAGLVLNGSQPKDTVHPAAGLLATLAGQEGGCDEAALIDDDDGEVGEAEDTDGFELRLPGGLVGEVAHYMIETARRPQPLLSVGASLCALGALMGRNYRTASNLRPNLYIVGIADSGSGKNHSREVINELFYAAGVSHYLGGNKIASGAGLLTAVHRQPAILFQIDEFGMFLSAAADRKRSPRHLTEILDNMTELYTAAGGMFLGAEYANRDGKNARRDISQPCLCVYGTTTPLHFWGALRGANVADGSLARFIVLPTDQDYPDENTMAKPRLPEPGLVDDLRFLAEGITDGRGNLVGLTTDGSTALAMPTTVPMSLQAQERFIELSNEITEQLRQAAGTAFTSILARIAENAQKVALILAVGKKPWDPVIELEDANWAIDFVRHFAGVTMKAVDRHVADTEVESHAKRMKEILRAAGRKGLTRSELTRASQWIKGRDRGELLASLIEAGEIEAIERKSATKPATIFRLSKC
jgi:hypothetical protein